MGKKLHAVQPIKLSAFLADYADGKPTSPADTVYKLQIETGKMSF